MAKPKLALVPAAQGSKFYSVLPSSGVGDFNFTRSGSATRINSQGLIETVGSGVSRLNYPMIDGVVKGCPHHILEPQRTNLITYSEDFSQSTWVKINSTIVSNQEISPDGTLNADKLNILTNTWLYSTSTAANGYYSVSIFAKAGDISVFKLGISDNVQAELIMNVDLSNETFTTEVGSSWTLEYAKIENYGNGWFRCSISGNNTVTSTSKLSLIRGVENGHIYIWGAQLEEGSYPTSYIPTSGSAVTRSAETANGSGDADTFNDSEGVLMVETKFLVADTRLGISNADNSDQVLFGNANGIFYRITENNANPITQFIGVSEFENHKIALKYKSTQTSIFVDGFELDTNITSYSLSGLNELALTAQGSNLYGSTKQLQYYDSALTDSELETLTSWVSFSDMAEAQLYSVE